MISVYGGYSVTMGFAKDINMGYSYTVISSLVNSISSEFNSYIA
jgi:hypothetical protein